MSDLQRKLQLAGLPPRPTPGSNAGLGGRGRGGARRGIGRRDYTPVPWGDYFETKQDVAVDEHNTFRVYMSGQEGPVLFFLHGGGFSALSWACISKIIQGLVTCRCAAMDFRGHGHSKNTDEKDMSAEVLARDVGNVVQTLYGEDAPPIILVGHSMGGAIGTHIGHLDLVPSLIGLVVIDVVEGTAVDALSSMQSYLRGRPKTFKSLDAAIEWCVRTGQVRNLESAKVSMVGQLKKIGDTESVEAQDNMQGTSAPVSNSRDTIQEEDEEAPTQNSAPSQPTPAPISFKSPSSDEYTWRIDLSRTEPYWRGWFEGLSNKFLNVPVPKMLLLAGVDRLDKDLTVGQMQGKFQMQVLPQCGHAVHEDNPDRVAEVLATFMIRHKVATAKDDFQMSFPAC